MSLQSRFVSSREGEFRRKNSYGDSLSLVECAADARFENTSSSTGGFQGLPSESFLLPSPGRLSAGLKTQRRLLPRPPALGADCLFRQVGRAYCRIHYIVVILLHFNGILGYIKEDPNKRSKILSLHSLILNRM